MTRIESVKSVQSAANLLLALGSGAAALIYEIVWFQILELIIGSSAVSLAVLLATFMGGTCLGSLIFPRLALQRHHPLRVYAAIEFVIAGLGVLILLVMPLVGGVYTAWSGYGIAGYLLRGIVAAVCLLPPTLLMGATLPALARRVPSSPAGVPSLGFLYAANIAGAVLGCLLSGFYLLREYDVTTATLFAAAVNVAIGAVALFLATVTTPPADSEAMREVTPVPEFRESVSVSVAIGLSGFCALAAEAIWTRTLGLLFGASVYTFSIVLAVFLLGLGIGSSVGSLIARTLVRPRLALGWCQLLAAAAIAWTSYALSASLPYWPINPSITTDVWFNFQLDLDRAFWALLPPTLLWGASFPLALAAIAPGRQDSARLMAWVYGANTLGAIAGALAATLLLIAWVGSQRAQQSLIVLSVGAGLLVLLRSARASSIAAVIGAALCCALLVWCVPPLSKVLVAHGRFAATWVGKSDILYAKEGLNSSVAVSSFPTGALTFHVAGKIQASNVPRDMRLQRMLGHLTSLTSANPRSVLVIGCGAGITAGAVSIDPRVEQLTLVEIEPLVPEAASTYFRAQNFDVLRSSKVRLHIDDGRHYLQTTDGRFDAITADPLDPWVKGAANLYTKEFFEEAKRRLNPGGVITMYMQLFENNTEAVKSAVATFFEVFPNGTLWGNTFDGKGHDMVMLGQVEPFRIDLDEMDRRLNEADYADVKQSLREVGMSSAVDLFATYAGRRSELVEWLRDAPINRDGNLRMQYLAGMGLNLDEAAMIYAEMLAYRRFPEDLFTTARGLDALKSAIENEGR
jgi:spermidine synthase